MNVSMNGLRRNMVNAYNSLCELLLDNIENKESDPLRFNLDRDELISKMNELSMVINNLNYIYNPDDPDFIILEDNDTIDFLE